MSGRRLPVDTLCLLFLTYFAFTVIATGGVSERGTEKQELETVREKCKNYQQNVLTSLRDIFLQEQNCQPCPQFQDENVNMKLAEAEGNVTLTERKLKKLVEVAVALSDEKRSAHVTHPNVGARLHTSQVVSCEARGTPLIACLWRQSGQRGAILIIDDHVVQNGLNNGVSYVGNGLSEGKCAVEIQDVDKAGDWICTLVGQDGIVFRGKVEVTVEAEPTLENKRFRSRSFTDLIQDFKAGRGVRTY